ncbi:hypothetical protein [Emergencia timonensis]|uniref:hypothetical protein n=1 Tax=Emergencia timonensis TaxID=1776384 RepID=UPI0024A960E4|nr:hypothetical protein [Emergencia timonensis]
MEIKVNNLETKVDNLEIKVDNLETKVDNLEIKVDNLETKVDNLEIKVNNLETRVSKLELDAKSLHSELALIKRDLKQVRVCQETKLIPRLSNIEACYLDTSIRYQESADKVDVVCEDVQLLKKVVGEHSEKLKKIKTM